MKITKEIKSNIELETEKNLKIMIEPHYYNGKIIFDPIDWQSLDINKIKYSIINISIFFLENDLLNKISLNDVDNYIINYCKDNLREINHIIPVKDNIYENFSPRERFYRIICNIVYVVLKSIIRKKAA